ncbi:MAG: CD225/dispanin family protein [Bacteroidales bacterium]|nr:CD225/dispanin family protein [Bacteroidales bacterium]
MKKYFYTDGTTNFGPFSLEELKEKHISRDTMVWFQELGEWKRAETVSELNELFLLAPPPLPGVKAPEVTKTNKSSVPSDVKPPKTWLVESILATLLCCLPFGIVGIVYASKVETRFYAGDLVGAVKASSSAETWTLVSFFFGLFGFLVFIGMAIFGTSLAFLFN